MPKTPPRRNTRPSTTGYTITDPTAGVASARARLYSAFEQVDFDPAMTRMASVSDADVAALSGSVADLDPVLVARFVLKAGTSWGRPNDLRRVTPRALDLAAEQQLPLDRGLLWAKLRWAGWQRWPTYQALTVREFLRAEWARLIRSDPRPAHLGHHWLREASVAVEDLGPFLDEWLDALAAESPPPHHRAATGHLVMLLLHSPLRPDLPDTVAKVFLRQPEAAGQMARWLDSDATDAALARAAERLADTSDSRRVLLAGERLRRFRAARDQSSA